MYSILKKEIRSFLSSLIAYVVMIVFLVAIGLFMWVLPEYNLFDMGYANMDTLFSMALMVFIFHEVKESGLKNISGVLQVRQKGSKYTLKATSDIREQISMASSANSWVLLSINLEEDSLGDVLHKLTNTIK